MNNTILNALISKRNRLTESRERLKEKYEFRIAELDKKIADIDSAVSTVNEVLETVLCPNCRGRGTVRKFDVAGQGGNVECEICGGTGVK